MHDPADSNSTGARILLTDTNRWPATVRLAIGFRKMGCRVAVLCPVPHHPVQKTNAAERIYHYSGLRPVASLRTAIEDFSPTIVIPACDRGVRHLHTLHHQARTEGAAAEPIAALIERSLGPAESFPVVASRYGLLELARQAGIRVPTTVELEQTSDLEAFTAENKFPWMLKADGTSAGRGVRVARDADEAGRDFAELSRPASALQFAKILLLNRNRDWAIGERKGPQPAVIAQSFVDGRPANCAVVCCDGKILAGIAVEVIRASGPRAPSTVVEVVEGSEMLEAARLIASRLRLSGFFGLDFMIENATSAAWLIEMNPRCTPLCPLPLGSGRDLVAALSAQLAGEPLPECRPVTTLKRIAFFPQAWNNGDHVANGRPTGASYHDIPDSEPALIQELLHPWPERSLLGQFLDMVRKKWSHEKKTSVCFLESDDLDSSSAARPRADIATAGGVLAEIARTPSAVELTLEPAQWMNRESQKVIGQATIPSLRQ